MKNDKKSQTLGVWTLTALVVGNMIGSGVFLLPSSLAHFGTISIFSWMITALGAMVLALVFAKLSASFPKTGGPYIYCKEGFGRFVGFQVAYSYWIYMWVGNAAIAVAFTGYLTPFFPTFFEHHWCGFLITVGIVWFFTVVNLVGMRFAGLFQLILTVLKIVPLILIAIIGLFYIEIDHLCSFNVSHRSHLSALSGGAVLTLWAFLGMESASIPADNVKNPQKIIPRATMMGTAMTAIIYILSTVAIMGAISIETLQQSTAPFADFAGKIFGKWGHRLIGVTAIVSCAGALNGWILLQGQIPLAAARDSLFPQSFGRLSRSGVPAFGILISSTLVTLLLYLNFSKKLVDQFTFIISFAVLFAIIAYLYTSITEFLVHIKNGPLINKKATFKMVILSLLAFMYTFWLMISAGQKIVFYGVLLMFTSIPIYGWIEWQKQRPGSIDSSFETQ